MTQESTVKIHVEIKDSPCIPNTNYLGKYYDNKKLLWDVETVSRVLEISCKQEIAERYLYRGDNGQK